MEGLRILAHLLKDHEEGEWHSSSSGWFKRAVNEAEQALLNPQDWEGHLAPGAKGKGNWSSSSSSGSWANWGASSSSAPFEPAKGGGKGYDHYGDSTGGKRGFR